LHLERGELPGELGVDGRAIEQPQDGANIAELLERVSSAVHIPHFPPKPDEYR
jgi:hypothetical protein